MAMSSCGLGAIMPRRGGTRSEFVGNLSNDPISDINDTLLHNEPSGGLSSGDFPICTDLNGPIVPFCLPEDGADILADTTYYVTWNADVYPLNATIHIELIYSESSEGTSAFTSERTDNSYGYIPIHMRKEWLQGKASNTLTLYIIELDPTLDRRASARQGPTVTLLPRPVEHYKPSPSAPFNKLALRIGLPASFGVVIIIVAGLYFGMRKSRRIGHGNIMGSHDRGYGIRKSRTERLGRKRTSSSDTDESSALNKSADDAGSGLVDGIPPDLYPVPERRAGDLFIQGASKQKRRKF